VAGVDGVATEVAVDLREPHAAPRCGIEGAGEQCGDRVGDRLPEECDG
jgi:hypothetical protein